MRDAPIFPAYLRCPLLVLILCGAVAVVDGFAASSSKTALLEPVCLYREITIPPTISNNADATDDDDGSTAVATPQQLVSVEDLTPTIEELLKESGIAQGTVTVISRHTTTAITINELESRLQRDMEQVLLQLIPPDERSVAASSNGSSQGVRYQHNDIDQRPESAAEAERCRLNGWAVDTDPAALAAWRVQEPINAHAHLLSMLLGSSEAIPVVDGQMVIGQWQSVMMVDWDGPRSRTVGIQVIGFQ